MSCKNRITTITLRFVRSNLMVIQFWTKIVSLQAKIEQFEQKIEKFEQMIWNLFCATINTTISNWITKKLGIIFAQQLIVHEIIAYIYDSLKINY